MNSVGFRKCVFVGVRPFVGHLPKKYYQIYKVIPHDAPNIQEYLFIYEMIFSLKSWSSKIEVFHLKKNEYTFLKIHKTLL